MYPDMFASTSQRFTGKSFITFVFLCMFALALCMLTAGFLLQISALLSPWLLTNGLAMLKGVLFLFCLFRTMVFFRRGYKWFKSTCVQWSAFPYLLFAAHLVKGTLFFLLRKIAWLLIQ